MVDNDRSGPRPSLSEATTIDGARSIAVVDVLARTTVWSMTVAPSEVSVWPTADDRDETRPVRAADEVLATVRGADLLAAPLGTTGGWSEVVLIDESHFHILRPLGAAADALVVELVLDARSANLAVARHRFADLVSTYDAPPIGRTADHPDRPDRPEPPDRTDPPGHPDPPDPGQPSARAAGHPADAAPLPRRVATPRRGTVGPDPARLVDEPILDRVVAALRTLT